MLRAALVVALLAPVARTAADEPKGAKVDFVVHSGHFEKNNAGLKDNPSFLALTSAEAFDKVFGVAFVMGKKPNVVPKGAFEKSLVVATVARGNYIRTYDVEQVTLADGTLSVKYKSTDQDGGTASFASPLIVSVPKDKVKKVQFIENGKKAGEVEVK
jgi:hypothetical protein